MTKKVLSVIACIAVLSMNWIGITYANTQTNVRRITLPPVVVPEGNSIEALATRAAYTQFHPCEEGSIIIIAVDIIDTLITESGIQLWVCLFAAEYVRFEDVLVPYMSGTPICMMEFSQNGDEFCLENFIFPVDGERYGDSLRKLCAPKPGLFETIDLYIEEKGSKSDLNYDAVTTYLEQNNLLGISVELSDGSFRKLT